MKDQKWWWVTDRQRATNGVKYFKYFSQLEKSVWINLSSGASKWLRHFHHLQLKNVFWVFFFPVWSAWATALSLGPDHEKVNERQEERKRKMKCSGKRGAAGLFGLYKGFHWYMSTPSEFIFTWLPVLPLHSPVCSQKQQYPCLFIQLSNPETTLVKSFGQPVLVSLCTN